MKFFYMIKKNKRIHLFLMLLVISINLFVLKTDVTASTTEIDSNVASPQVFIEYFEDTKGNLTFEQITSEKFKNSFKLLKGSIVSIGYSKSSWWYRIKVKDTQDFDADKYLSANKADIEKIIVYVPQVGKMQDQYYTMQAGWGVKHKVGDIGFLYPVFKLPNNIDFDKYIYVQVKSMHTHNYEFKVIYHEQLDAMRQVSLFCIGTLFGILIAMILYNFILFMFLKSRVYLYYVIYMLMMVLYQSGLTGAIKIFKWKSGHLIEEYFWVFGFFMLVAAIVFIREFLKTDKNVPWHDKFLKVFLGLIITDISIALLGYEYVLLVTSGFIINAVVILVLSTSICCLYKKVRQARYFILAWSVMIIGTIVFTLRGFGFIPQNLLTISGILIGAAIESILISVALADRIKILREEKEAAGLLLLNAEKTSKLNEIAFLKAQIKPHFLYNALNVIAALCRIEPERASELIIDLSNYLHNTFDINNKSEYITFEEELEFIEAYVRIEKARFRDKLKVEYEIKDIRGLMFPSLILQPLVENAIRHGIRKKEEGGTVIVRVKNEKDYFIIEVEDNGRGMSKEELEKIQSSNFERGKGIGIVNIKLRLKEIYGTDLKIESEINKGTLVSFKIPRI